MSISASVLNRLNHMRRGLPFSIKGFYNLGSELAVQKTMSRLAAAGVVVRVSRGFYVRPKPLKSVPSVVVTAGAEQVARAWARNNGYKLVSQGEESAYRMGLQTQAPMRKVFWTNGPSREFKIGNELVEVRHTSEQKLKWGESPEGELFRGLLATPPENIGFNNLRSAVNRLPIPREKTLSTLQKLKALPALKGWKNKLEEIGNAI